MTERERFDNARLLVLGETYGSSGIGTLGERALHRILKLYFEPDESFHEIKFLGSVADIKNSEGITEIQTRQLSKLVPKLEKFLPECHVTVVYPLDFTKFIRTIDKKSGEISERRRSPKRSDVFDSFYELYNIRSFLSHPNLSVKLVFINVDEFRFDSERVKGRVRHAVRAERIPFSIERIVELNTRDDYRVFIPDGLPEEFCAADFNRLVGKRFKYGYSGIQILLSLGLVEPCGKAGRKILYKLVK